jgi:hypothetical protein
MHMNEHKMDYVELLKALLVEERGHSAENAERLVKSYPSVVTQGIMAGNMSLRGCAMALEMKDDEPKCPLCHGTGWDGMGYTLSCRKCNPSACDLLLKYNLGGDECEDKSRDNVAVKDSKPPPISPNAPNSPALSQQPEH